ncbi:MAG: adenylate/guanylate cyclase domain-containing protein [Chloroflexi bacterium]|nr:adenylate/guanylate cyclase domain-containing protein [Chloroflexota bacterium]
MTVLFADVRGYTGWSERTPLPALRGMLNELYVAATAVVLARDGLLDKFVGDAVMALFNAPIPSPRHREVALDAAVALLEAIGRSRSPLEVGVGVNTGLAMTGNVGGDVLDYTAIGDVVNVASRLSGLASPGELLAAASTWEGRGARFATISAEATELAVKGRAEPVTAYRLSASAVT